jgi:hypothetical protein
MAEYDAGGPGLFPSAEAVGMKRAREDGFDAATEAGQQPAGPWPGYPGENVYRLVVPVNRVSNIREKACNQEPPSNCQFACLRCMPQKHFSVGYSIACGAQLRTCFLKGGVNL